MSEIRSYRAYTIAEELYCDCGRLMNYTGECPSSAPPQFIHGCDCGHRESHPRIYPLIHPWKEVEYLE